MSDAENLPEVPLPELIANRRVSRDAIAGSGRPVYPNRFPVTHLVSDVVRLFSPMDGPALDALSEAERTIRVPGRILSIRRMGKKAVFADLSDGRERIQA